jgi:hypothetical protein
MDLHELTVDEFQSTMSLPMTDITESTQSLVNAWHYAEKVMAKGGVKIPDTGTWEVEYIFQNRTKNYHHILINTGLKGQIIVIVYDVRLKTILGHYFLNIADSLKWER